MKRIWKHTNDNGHSVEVLDAGTMPVTFVIRVDAPGERAVSCSVPERYFADIVNVINLGPNFADLPGGVHQVGDSDSAVADDQQV